jgi:branched-subunit amino acid aminotransferase/4-amino-4-deoxychorismate lyase
VSAASGPRAGAAEVVSLVLDGRTIPPDQAASLPLERGLLYGDGLFESMRVHRGAPLDLEAHFARMAESADVLGFPAPSPAAWDAGIATALAPLEGRDAEAEEHSVRVTWSRGATRARAYAPGPGDGPPRLLVAAYARRVGNDESKTGRTAILLEGMAPGDLGRHKTLSAMTYVVAQARAQARHADQALLLDAQWRVLGAAGSNLFARLRSGGLATPPLSLPILPGITRARVLAWRRDVREVEFLATDLVAADEVFVTNAVRGIVPIVRIDRQPVGNGEVGEVTRELQRLWREGMR